MHKIFLTIEIIFLLFKIDQKVCVPVKLPLQRGMRELGRAILFEARQGLAGS